MAREVTIVTPENVTITYELAGLGSRAIAWFLDILIQLGFLAALAILLISIFVLWGTAGRSELLRTLGDFAAGIAIVTIFVVFVGYFIIYEAVRNGQTPGKRACGLRVVREEGGPLDASGAVIRNLIRVIELVIGAHVSSIIFILFSPKYKRLGDYAAGTIVVKELKGSKTLPDTAPKPVAVAHPEAALVKDSFLLSVEEIAAIRRFVERRPELKPDLQESLALQIAIPLMTKLAIVPPPGPFSHANFLEALYRLSVEERGLT